MVEKTQEEQEDQEPKFQREDQDPPETQDDELCYDLSEKIVTVRIKNKDGTTTRYELHEATEEVVVKWRDRAMRQARVTSTGKKRVNVQMGDSSEGDAFLISQCLFNREDGRSVGLGTVLKWPSRVVKPIHRKLIEISEIDFDEDESKN